MKKLLLLSVIVLFSAYAGNVFASAIPVNVLTSYFSISGTIEGVNYDDWSPYSFSYADSGSIPLAISMTNGSNGWYSYDGSSAFSKAGFFYVATGAWGNPGCDGWASAGADILFQPLSPMTQLTIYYQGNSPEAAGDVFFWGNIELKDLTDGIQIFSQAVPYSTMWSGGTNSGSYLIDYSFQKNNVYGLYLSSQAYTNYDEGSLDIWTNDMSAVPEPATMLLLGLGLIGLAGVRRKIKK